MNAKVAVIGIGNPWGGDDAAGLLAARLLRSAVPPDVRVVEHDGDPTGLLDAWEGVHEAIVIDAMRSGAPPGTVRRLSPLAEPVPARDLRAASTHAIGVVEAIELGRALERLPRRLVVYGIEGECFAASATVAGDVERAVERVVAEVGERLRVAPWGRFPRR